MKISSSKQRSLLAAIALTVAVPMMASAQTSTASSSSLSTPIVATNGQRPPGVYGAVRDFGDVQRAEMQQRVHPWPWSQWQG